ncbi:MAG: FeoA family protein [Minicystis sp.]
MIETVSSPPVDWEVAQAAPSRPPRTLAAIEPGGAGAVMSVELDEDLSRWLAGLGIARGDRVVVLRRAPFGGPIHLRTHTGGEFAVDRSLAQRIHVEAARAEDPEGAL